MSRCVTEARSNLSDFSDGIADYDSSDEEYRQSKSRRQSYAAPPPQSRSRRQSQSQPMSPNTARRAPPAQPAAQQYRSLRDDDPFADDGETPVQENKRMQCEFEWFCF
jgi:hypothetical protein